MRIDSHHHFWNYDHQQYGWINDGMKQLKRDFTPSDLQPLCDAAGIAGVVSVQARQSLAETDWLIEIAERHQLVRGVVGWVPLAEKNIEQHLEQVSRSSWLKGVRHVVQDEPDDAFILGADFNRGVKQLSRFGLIYDILIFSKHLPNAIKFVDMHPEQPFVLDHIAKPTIRLTQFDHDWEKNLRELAKRPHVACKFSGVVTEVRDDTWSADVIRPYWDVALDAFGPDRLMYGSDWPVCLLRSSYDRWVSSVAGFAGRLSASEQARFWGLNAQRTYGLSSA